MNQQVQSKYTVEDYTPEDVEFELERTIYMPSSNDLKEYYELNEIPIKESEAKLYFDDLAERVHNNSNEIKELIRHFYYSQLNS